VYLLLVVQNALSVRQKAILHLLAGLIHYLPIHQEHSYLQLFMQRLVEESKFNLLILYLIAS
jgi:hypothetical protein